MDVVARLRRLTMRVDRRMWGRERTASQRTRRPAVASAPEWADAPIASFYASATAPTLVNIPLHRCRGLLFAAFSCNPDSDHPFIRTMVASERGGGRGYVGSPLQAYYDRWQPASAVEALGLHDMAVAGPLGGAPALAAVAPWWPVPDLAAFASDFAVAVEVENAEKGRPLPAEAGCLLHGPVSLEKGELEYARCIEIYETVRDSGYRRSSETADGDIRGQVLVREDGAYVVLVLNGQHRIAAAAAAGLESVPIRFFHGANSGSRDVRRSDVERWPSVQRGWFTVPQALHVFDRLFSGMPPWAAGGSQAHASDSRPTP